MMSSRPSRVAVLACVTACLVFGTLAAPALAKKNDPNVHLDFRPQQAVAGAEVSISPDMLRRPVAVKIEDLRAGDDPADIGVRTDDDDRRHILRATNEVLPYVESVFDELLQEWGIKTEAGADLVLTISLAQLKILETNQAVGATYNAEVRLAAEITGGGDWSGGASGDATRYGKKFSNANVNEVLSDALLEALANLLSEPGVHEAWEP